MESALKAELRGYFEELGEKLRQDIRSELHREPLERQASPLGEKLRQDIRSEQRPLSRQVSPAEKDDELPPSLTKKVTFGNLERKGTNSESLGGQPKTFGQIYSSRPLRRWVQADLADDADGDAFLPPAFRRQNSRISDISALATALGIGSATSDNWASPRQPEGEPSFTTGPRTEDGGGLQTLDIDGISHSSSKRGAAISTRSSLVNASGGFQFFERALGLKNDSEAPRLLSSSRRAQLMSILQSQLFEQGLVAVIVIQTALVGLQIDDMATNNSHTPSIGYRISDLIICSLFAIEVALKLYVYRLAFFCVSGWAWNIMDLLLIVAQITEEILIMSVQDAVGSGVNFSVLRAIRMLRCVRILRVLRLTSFFDDLRRLVACMIHSVQSFVWSLVLLFLFLYMYGIYLTQSVHLHLLEAGSSAGDEDLRRWYGSVPQAILALFQALTGGVDWNEIVEPLSKHMGAGWAVVTTLWMAFLILAVMNIITGNFVQNSISLAAKVKSMDEVFQAKRLFKCLDTDSSGAISTHEIHNHLGSPAVQEFFRSVDVDVSEAEALFQILDVSGDGLIDCDEFISGCLRLQGGARAVDLVLMTIDTRRGFEHINASLRELADKIQALPDMTGCHVEGRDAATNSDRLLGG